MAENEGLKLWSRDLLFRCCPTHHYQTQQFCKLQTAPLYTAVCRKGEWLVSSLATSILQAGFCSLQQKLTLKIAMHCRRIILFSFLSELWCYSVALQGSSAAVENGIGGFLEGRQYDYSYSSSARIFDDTNLTLQAKVSLTVLPAVSRSEENEIHVDISEFLATWITPGGNTSDPSILGSLSGWFSLVKEENGGAISSVYYPRAESNATVAFKKSLGRLVSLSGEATRFMEDGRVSVVVGRNRRTNGKNYVEEQKELRYNSEGVLVSAVGYEELHANRSQLVVDHAPSSSKLLGIPMMSQSRLTLLGTEAAPQTLTRPLDLVRDIVGVTQVHDLQPLSELLPAVSSALNSCTAADCPHLLLPILRHLNPTDLADLLPGLTVPTSRKLPVVDALGAAGVDGDQLAGFINANEEEEVVERVLMNFALGHFPITQTVVDATFSLLSSPLGSEVSSESGFISPHLQHVAILSLGGMAGILSHHAPQLANQIKSFLQTELDHVSGRTSSSSTSRLRRSADDGYHSPTLHAVILDSVGNARASELQEGVVTDLSGSSGLSVKHSAVKALGKFNTMESAEALLLAAQSSPHPSVVQLAAAAYNNHPHRSQDLSHLLAPSSSSSSSSSHQQRSRRQVQDADSADVRVSMPGVNWNREFGDGNISVSLGRRLRNDFSINTAPLTSTYSFSVFDEVSFDADMELSGGSQHNSMWGAELCLQGSASYDRNILQSASHNASAEQFERLQQISPSLEQNFQRAYVSIRDSATPYQLAASQVTAALNSLPSRLSAVQQALDRYGVAAASVMDDYLKENAGEVQTNINNTLTSTQTMVAGAVPIASAALSDLVPSLPQAFSSTVLVDSLPFTEGRFLTRYIPAAPQQAMTNIFNVYRSSLSSYGDLRSSYEALDDLLDPYGSNHPWLSPQNAIRNIRSDITILTANIEASLTARNYLQLSDASIASLNRLLSSVTSDLLQSLDLLEAVGIDIAAARLELAVAFGGSKTGMDTFTRAYERARQEIDLIFGQKFHPSFPRSIRSCGNGGCGNYPSTANGAYNDGIDVVFASSATSVPSPLSAYVQRFNASVLPASMQHLYTSALYENSIVLTPAEPSYNSVWFVLSNLVPATDIGSQTASFVAGGAVIGTPSGSIHVELVKTLVGGQSLRMDPSSFLQPASEAVVDLDMQCNEVVTSVGGVVVDRNTLVTGSPAQRLIGTSLTDVPGNEFPQPYDIILSEGVSLQPPSQVTFFQSSTFLMVGQIPVEFDFSGVGTYQLNVSLFAGFLSGQYQLSSTPTFSASTRGSVRVGGTTYADVSLQGTLLETKLPLSFTQNSASWPLLASSSMDIVLVPSTVNLTTQLVRRQIGGSVSAGVASEVLESNVIWSYSIPPLQKDEFYYQGILKDATPPLFTALTQSDCLVRQLPGRSHDNPAFEVLALAADPQGKPSLMLGVGTSPGFDDVLSYRDFQGDVVTLYQPLQPAVELFFTVIATNRNGVQSRASCVFLGGHYYDRSLPQARVTPIRTVSSNPSQVQVLLSLFDEYQLEEVQEVAVGTVPGSWGTDVQSWTPFNLSLIQTPPMDDGQVLHQFSFARAGRLVSDFLEVLYNTPNVTLCGRGCLAHSSGGCRSFDYSSSDRVCILHSNIEGPSNSSSPPGDNIFYTPALQAARGYYHYERLGLGNSTLMLLSGLSLRHGVMYYVNVRLDNRLGYRSVVSSPGFLVDLTPPVPILIGPPASVTMAMEAVYPGGCEGVDAALPGCIDSVYPRTLDRSYTDGNGSGVVFNGPVFLTDSLFTSSPNTLSANWNPFLDPESSIYSYVWCIGTSIGSCDILSFTNPHLANGIVSQEAWTHAGVVSGLNLAEGSYFISVRATNDAAYGGPLFTTVNHSTPYTVDITPPTVSSTVDMSYNRSTNQLSVEYVIDDGPGGRLSLVELALGRTELDTGVLGWQVLSDTPTTGMNRDMITVPVPDGVPVWLKLRVTDAAGLQAIFAAADFFTVDRTPPLTGRVGDGLTVGVDDSYVGADRNYCVNWVGFSDPESGLGAITWSVVRSSGDVTVFSRSVTQAERMVGVACEVLPSLTHNVTYYSRLSVSNAAMETQTVVASTNGMLLDISSPEVPAGAVVSFSNSSSLFVGSPNSLDVSWPSFQDYESGVSRYSVRVLVNGQEVSSETLEGTQLRYQRATFQFSQGDMMLVEVRGFNGAGGSAVVFSPPTVTVDLTPPQVSAVVDGPSTSEDLDYQSVSDSLTVSWLAQEDLSSITSITAVVYQDRAGQRTRFFPVLPDDNVVLSTNQNTATIADLHLVSGARYQVAVTFINGAGLATTYETNGVVVDLTPPTLMAVNIMDSAYTDTGSDANTMATDSITVVTSPNLTEVRWTGSDPESGISRYLVGVVNMNGSRVLAMEEEFSGLSVGGRLNLSSLGEGVHQVYVVAVNHAQLQSTPTFSSPFRIATGEGAGVVLDGPADAAMATTLDIDYTDEMTSISARFHGFTSEACPGGIVTYEWAVLAGSDHQTVLFDFTSHGIFESPTGSGSGHAQLPISGLDLWVGQRLYTAVRAVTGCGRVSQAMSDGFVIDLSPPLLEEDMSGAQTAGSSGGLYQGTEGYSVQWTAGDPESGVPGDATVRVGTYPGGADLEGPRPLSTDYVRGTVESPEGVPTYVTVTATNGAGLESEVVTEPITLDTTPPETGMITCELSSYPLPLVGVADDLSQINSTSGLFVCHWSGTEDPQSTLLQHTIAIGTSATDQSVLSSKRLLADQRSYTSAIFPSLLPNMPYYVTLTTFNRAGQERILVSDAVYLDVTPPTFQGSLLVYPNFRVADYFYGRLTNITISDGGVAAAVCLFDTDAVTVVFDTPLDVTSSSGAITGSFLYKIGVGYRMGSDDIVQFSSFFPVPLVASHPLYHLTSERLYHRLTRLSLASIGRRPFYVTLKVGNTAKLSSVLSSGPVYVKSDVTARPSWARDGFNEEVDIDYQASTVQIGGSFSVGVNCPIRSGRWAVEGVDGNLTQPYTSLDPLEGPPGATFQVRTDQVRLFNEETYRVLLQVTDLSGEVHVLRSDGVTVTTRAVTPGQVTDGPVTNQDLNYQESRTTLQACWSGFGDGTPEQDIDRYEVAAGNSPSLPQTQSSVAPFVNVGRNRTHQFHNLSLVPESVEYFITVRAYTVSGAYVEAYSNGIRVGLQTSILPGSIDLAPYQSGRTSLSAHWSGFQSNLPVFRYEWALGSSQHSGPELAEFCSNVNSNFSREFDVSGFVSVGLDTSTRITGLDLQDNTTYYLTVRVLDQAKNCIAVETPSGVTIDETLPTLDSSSTSVLLGPTESRQADSGFVVYVSADENLSVQWEEFTDEESGIESYSISIHQQTVCGNQSALGVAVFGPVNVGLATTADIGSLDLQPATPYVAVVTATNRAGLSSRAFSQPILVDSSVPVPGTVKDGLFWDSDVQYQSNLSMLSATFSYSMLPPTPGPLLEGGACPNDLFFRLDGLSPEWNTGSSPRLAGYVSTATLYSPSQVSVSADPLGIGITIFRDPTSAQEVVQTGMYQTVVDLTREGVFQADIQASRGFPSVQQISVTTVVFVDSGEDSNVVPKFEPSNDRYGFGGEVTFKAFGLQIYNNFTNATHSLAPRLVLWSRDPTRLGEVQFLERDIPQVDLSVTNTYRVEFEEARTSGYVTRSAKLYINGKSVLTLYGLPPLSNSTRVVFTSFNMLGMIPLPSLPTDTLSSLAVFSNVSLPPAPSGGLCDRGTPFHSRTSPVVQFRAGVGTRPGVDDIYPLQLLTTPCLSCLPGPCNLYACNPACSGIPYLINVTLDNLTLSPGYGAQLDLPKNSSSVAPPPVSWFQPATYHVVVEATTASGRVFTASSNGVVMDVSPPVLVGAVVNYDISFSRSQPVRFQSNNSTLAASWRFRDEQSFIVDYSWAIGTAPFSTDVQGFVSVGLSTEAELSGLLLTHNTTYYVTVTATNGAGLVTRETSAGVTYIATELNVTLLNTLVDVEFVVLATFTDQNGVVTNVRVADDDERAGVSWSGVPADIDDLTWRIGSSPGAEDILPPVTISLSDSALPSSARVTGGILYHGGQVLSEVSEVIALHEGKETDPRDNNFYFQPASLLYQSIEFCNFVHVCTVSMGAPSIVIRRKDVDARVLFAGAPTRLTVAQTAPAGININSVHVLDRTYFLQLFTATGLRVGSSLYAGFLDQSDVVKTYRSATPYISNPILSMSMTSRDVARRFTEFGGPSFYVSFLGQDSLDGPLELNVTFDSMLDWGVASPELAYWDTGASVWRQVSETCGNMSSVDFRTFTIAVQVCSTVTAVATPSSRSRRQAGSTTPATMTTASYLERAVQFIVMRVGNVSSNTAPQLLLPSDPVQVSEDSIYVAELQYADAELDVVDFGLGSVPTLGNVTLTSAGMLTYEPCQHCTGMDAIEISIQERPIGENHTPLTAVGRLTFQIVNVNDPPVLFAYETGLVSGSDSAEVTLSDVASGYVESNRTSPAPVVTVAAVDVDGFRDSLSLVVLQDGRFGNVGFRTRLDAVGVLESLPLTFPPSASRDLTSFWGNVTFLTSYVTYLPSDSNFVGNDSFQIAVQDSRAVRSTRVLSVSVEVLPSRCQNDGTCAGSEADPTCTDVASRRGGAEEYNCTCPAGFTGDRCEVAVASAIATPMRVCPPGIPVVQCEGNPCEGAFCPSHPQAQCRPNYCGSCRAEWFVGSDQVSCHADETATVCFEPVDNTVPVILACSGVQCECPSQPFPCPPDSILVKNRTSDCCVTYECVCPNTSCPLLMECGQGVQPVPRYRGNQFPGRCCPEYNYEDINECSLRSENLCSETCINEERTYSCACPPGRTLASDGQHCGVCYFNDSQYLFGDRVQVGCNWCICGSDSLNEERWQCTAGPCDDGCFSDGVMYPLGAALNIEDLNCACGLTGRNSQDWMCTG